MKNRSSNSISSNPRIRAVKILQAVIGGKNCPKQSLQECFTIEDTPLVYQLTYGSLRFYHRLRVMVNFALKQPLSEKDLDIYLLILLGFYQIQYMDIPEYAILQETVEAASGLKKIWAKKLINAILRRFLREREIFEKQCLSSEEAHYSHPQWFVERVRSAWPEKWKDILIANNEKAPMHLRVNRLKISRDDYKETLNAAGIKAEIVETDGLVLEQATDVHKLPGFAEGWVSVQDASSQAVVDYLDIKPNQRVLDACAAPGGKACHILERQPSLSELVALDVSADRLKKITENLKRLQLKATLLCGDAALPNNWWDKQPFDRILIDAPCSATGVIRRHPDIKLLRTSKEVQLAVEKQKHILESLWPLLKINGRLVYTTCSILPEENQQQIDTFLSRHSDSKLIFTKQHLPGQENNSDGFFYAVIEKC